MPPVGPLQRAAAIMLHHHHNPQQMNLNDHRHHLEPPSKHQPHHHQLDLTSANNLLMSPNTLQLECRHKRSSVVSNSSDQCSSLNLSSVGSQASSAHHSPILEHPARHYGAMAGDEHERALGRLTISTDLGQKQRQRREPVAAAPIDANSGRQALLLPSCSLTSASSTTSDYLGSLPCSPASPASPIESSFGSPSGGAELLLLGERGPAHGRLASSSSSCSPDGALHLSAGALAPCDHTSLKSPHQRHQSGAVSSATNLSVSPSNGRSAGNSNNRLLHPLDSNQQQTKKGRSFSHSTSFSPLEAAGGVGANENKSPWLVAQRARLASDSRPSCAPSPDELKGTSVRPRRLSRIENRQSLHDLGYGRQESYFKLQRLGKGTYATVYMGRSKVNNDLVALKEILKEHDEGAPCTAIREVSLLRLLRHNNIVTLHDICHTPKKLTLVFEYVGPDLYAYMKENNHLLSIHNLRLLLYQLLRGISFCHSRQVLHRDLKPQNLLINSRGELKICDFGLARAKSIPTKSYSNEVVTLWYRPPDVLLGNTDYDHSIDMWGVGCIFYEMASGRTFFPGSSVRQQLYLIFSSLGAPSPLNWPEILTNPEYLSYSFPSFRPEKLAHKVPRLDSDGVQLLQSFLRFKPSERISAEAARRSSFFACLPGQIHHLHELESIFDVPGVYMSLNPGQKLSNHHHRH